MKTNELRIGNWVKRPDAKTDYDQIGREDFLYQNGFANIEDFEPILLDKEWLLKFGFELIGLWVKGDFELGLDSDDFVKNQFTIRFQRSIILKVKYVHQLQNLYFALTGNELEIK